MLLHTDFIADRRRRAQQKQGLVRWGVRLSLAVAIAALLPAAVLETVTSRHSAELLRTRIEIQQLSRRASRALTLRGLLARVEVPRRVVSQMRASNAVWSELLGEIRDRLPEDVWLTDLTIGPTPSPEGVPAAAGAVQQVVLVGLATGHEPLSEYLLSLNRSPWFRSAELAKSEKADADAEDGATIRFQVRVTLAKPLLGRAEGHPS